MDRPTTHPTDEAVDDRHLNEICSTAVCIARVAFPVTTIVYSLVFS